MSYRTVVISERSKLDLRMNFLEVRGEKLRKIHMDEIDILIIENPAVSMTGCLLEACTQKKIKVIFCDSRHNPHAELIPYYGSHDCSRKLKLQINWDEQLKGSVWTDIVREKIKNQALFLEELDKKNEAECLQGYINEIAYRDSTNREGHAAKVYFNALFGMDFSRDAEIPINAALNYGYSLLLSLMNKEIVLNGYNTEIGFFHDNIYNPYNLSSDLMEPFRPIIDRFVYQEKFDRFEKEEKHRLAEVLQTEVRIRDSRQVLPNAVKIYVKSVFDAMNEKDMSYLLHYKL